MRYRMLETLREYGSEQLAPEERVALAQRHAEFYLALVERAEECGLSSDLKETLDRLEAEHDNLRAVLAWSESDSGVVEIGLRLGGGLAGFWATRGYLREARERLARLLARAGEARTPERARAQACAGTVAFGLGAMEEACSLLTEALAMAREFNARREIAWSLRYLGHGAVFRGEYTRAGMLLEESRAIWDEIGNHGQAAGCLNLLGHVARYQGDYAAARAAFEKDLERLRAAGERDSLATQLKDLAILARYRGDYAEARSLAEESLALRRALGFRKGTAISLTALADVFREQGDLKTARRLYEEALGIRQELGERYGVASVLALLAHVIRLQGDPDRARSLCRQSLAIRREMLDRRGIAECLEGLAAVAAAEQQFPRSARLFGAAQALRDAIGSKAPPWERLELEQEVAALREALGEPGFLTAWNAGSALSWEQAVAEEMREG
jgi:tetratricopeptide (TPR) repeat protein